jgi:hypothetical protein
MSKIKTATYVTGDLTTKTGWWSDSASKTGQTLTDSGDGLTFTSPDTDWIDLTKVPTRDGLTGYDVKVYDNGTLQTSGYTVNYSNGSVTFSSSPTGPVTADYRYAQTSLHTITPPSGSFYTIPMAMAQFNTGATFSKGFQFKMWLNNATTGNTDYNVGSLTYCHARDIESRISKKEVCPGYGGTSSDIIKLYWEFANMFNEPGQHRDYSYKIYPVGTVVDPELREFNKMTIQMIDDELVTGTDFCTATFVTMEDDI